MLSKFVAHHCINVLNSVCVCVLMGAWASLKAAFCYSWDIFCFRIWKIKHTSFVYKMILKGWLRIHMHIDTKVLCPKNSIVLTFDRSYQRWKRNSCGVRVLRWLFWVVLSVELNHVNSQDLMNGMNGTLWAWVEFAVIPNNLSGPHKLLCLFVFTFCFSKLWEARALVPPLKETTICPNFYDYATLFKQVKKIKFFIFVAKKQ